MKLALAAVLLFAACSSPKYKLVEQNSEPTPIKDPPKSVMPPEDPSAPLSPFPQPAEKSQYVAMDWRTLRGLNTRTGEVTPVLRKLEGGSVKLTGYMVPFADEYQSANEFLLVPEAGMCVHTPPPPMNQIVFVQMTGSPAKVTFQKPVTVSGIISIAQSDSPYGKVAFKMEAAEAKEDASY
jgi:hypothetical protein